MRRIGFRKMHGLGNDFVVLDARREPLAVDAAAARALADRHTGIGCDQLIVIEPASASGADAAIRFFNADGSEAGACGNGTRCVAWLLGQESGASHVRLQTRAGLLDADAAGGRKRRGRYGRAAHRLARHPAGPARRTHCAPISLPARSPARSARIWATRTRRSLSPTPRRSISRRSGHVSNTITLFPERANIGVATVYRASPEGQRIRLRVWERGAGITRACGSGACAALVAAHRRG